MLNITAEPAFQVVKCQTVGGVTRALGNGEKTLYFVHIETQAGLTG